MRHPVEHDIDLIPSTRIRRRGHRLPPLGCAAEPFKTIQRNKQMWLMWLEFSRNDHRRASNDRLVGREKPLSMQTVQDMKESWCIG